MEIRPEEYTSGPSSPLTDRDEVETLTLDYPKRWHVEEFFNAHQAMGGTGRNAEPQIRYGQMTMALFSGRPPPNESSPRAALLKELGTLLILPSRS